MSKDHCTAMTAITVANAELYQQCISAILHVSTESKNALLEQNKIMADICKMLVSKRDRSDNGDTDDDGDVNAPARKKRKRN